MVAEAAKALLGTAAWTVVVPELEGPQESSRKSKVQLVVHLGSLVFYVPHLGDGEKKGVLRVAQAIMGF